MTKIDLHWKLTSTRMSRYTWAGSSEEETSVEALLVLLFHLDIKRRLQDIHLPLRIEIERETEHLQTCWIAKLYEITPAGHKALEESK